MNWSLGISIVALLISAFHWYLDSAEKSAIASFLRAQHAINGAVIESLKEMVGKK